NPDAADARIMVSRLCRPFLPNTVVLFRPTGHEKPEITGMAPYTEGLTAIEGKAAAYVCRDYTCELPTTDPDTMLELLHRP
ncbi:MAG: thioredoxin domain-containing protein, partial [Pseudomonadota bacterium]